MPKTKGIAVDKKPKRILIPLEVPEDLKTAIQRRAQGLDLSVNQYLRQLARRDLEAAA